MVALFGIPLALTYVYVFMPITLFSERRVTTTAGNAASGSSGGETGVDPNIGFKVDWDNVPTSGSSPSSPSRSRDAATSASPSSSAAATTATVRMENEVLDDM